MEFVVLRAIMSGLNSLLDQGQVRMFKKRFNSPLDSLSPEVLEKMGDVVFG